MSCQIQVVAKINDLAAIRRCLFPTDDNRGSDNWIQLCEISVSPVGDLIVIANDRKIVILSSVWDSTSTLSQFEVTHSGSIHDYDKVKAVLSLPVVESNGSNIVGPDWTCILVAFDSGFVRFYTETCQLLFEEQFHSENITSVKCQSQHGPRPDISLNLNPEEIYIQYQSNLVVLNGIQLFQLLKMYRCQLAKGTSLDYSQYKVIPKKWGFIDQSVIHDAAVVGFNLTSTFDHFLVASKSGGFDTKYRATPPHSTLVLATGSKPFLGYHYALEGITQPILSDVAKVVASKLKSALPTWLTGNKPQTEKQMSTAMQPVDNMGCRFGLCDLRRTATSICLSQDHKLAVICDALGRVLILDAFKGIVLKIFKGYREAQCSFLQVPEEKKTKHKIGNKIAHFLVIYSPKKGTLEVFSIQQWSKIVTFTASKYSKLIYINYGPMGFTETTKSKYVCQFNTLLIDNDGKVKEILVPFHFALSEKNSNRTRDIHIFKKLRHFLKSQELDDEKVLSVTYKTCIELKTFEMKQQTVELLLSHKNISADVMLKCAEYFANNLNDEESISLKNICENVCCLLNLYMFVSNSLKNDILNNENVNYEQMEDIKMNLQAKELQNLQRLLDISRLNDYDKLPKVHVYFSDCEHFSPADFLSPFDLSLTNLISLKSNVDAAKFRSSEIIFKPYILGDLTNFHELESILAKSNVSTESLFDMLVSYWVNRCLHINLNLEKEMNYLSILIYILARNAGDKTMLTTEYSSISVFWSKIREFLANSGRPFPALMAALLCRTIAQKIDTDQQMNDSPIVLESNMEVISQENVEWSILIGKLEDISLLNIVLANKPSLSYSSLPKLPYNKVDISLQYVLEHGKGCVSELVAQWLISSGINPQYLLTDKVQNDNTELLEAPPEEKKILDTLKLIRDSFPYSLTSSALLANMAWEYALAWQREIENLENLEASMKCLNFIQNIKIKQGLFQLMWNTHLKIVNESTCKLINKVGKLPKERLCKQDTGLSDYQISLFLSISNDFLDKFIDVTQESYQTPATTLQFENIWDNGEWSLIELAAQQKDVNFDLLHLHYQLILVLQLISTFSIKHTKPVSNLFEASVVNLFFTDLQKKVEVSWNRSDLKINSSRIQFLMKVISATMENITINKSGKIFVSDHVTWMSRCITLGRFWNSDIDILRRYQIIKLYFMGYDNVAQELIPAVADSSVLGKELLKIGVLRLSHILTVSTDFGKSISALSPSLTNYMNKVKAYMEDKDERCAPSSLTNLKDLTSHSINCLSEDESEYHLALLLLDACNNLEDEA